MDNALRLRASARNQQQIISRRGAEAQRLGQSRHAELGSASIVQHDPSVAAEKWTLERQSPKVKQVQGDGVGFTG
jgi:hypothetical protein